jgi:hypothetical protein
VTQAPACWPVSLLQARVSLLALLWPQARPVFVLSLLCLQGFSLKFIQRFYRLKSGLKKSHKAITLYGLLTSRFIVRVQAAKPGATRTD